MLDRELSSLPRKIEGYDLDGCELTLRIAMFLPRLSKRSLGMAGR